MPQALVANRRRRIKAPARATPPEASIAIVAGSGTAVSVIVETELANFHTLFVEDVQPKSAMLVSKKVAEVFSALPET